MFRRASFISLALFLPLLVVGLLLNVSLSNSQMIQPEQKLNRALRSRLEEQPDAPARFLVHLTEKANLQQNLPLAQDERHATVVRRLQQTAESSQADLVDTLAQLKTGGDVIHYSPLWIVNAIIVEAYPEVAHLLAQRPEVAHLELDARQQYIAPPRLQPQEAPPEQWNIDHVRARHAWNGLGVTGLGVTIAIMDTGVDWLHADLYANYRGVGSGGVVRHEGNWFDALGNPAPAAEPFDPNGHGTHVAGTAVGRGGTGVAPDAKWVAVRAFDSNGFATTSDLHLAFQWLLAPDGLPEMAPDVVNGSWSGGGSIRVFEDDIHALHQAGIVTVFAAGNTGPLTGTIGAPASYADAIGVAAVDYRDEVTWFSARGPSPLTAKPKPELAAPGARIYSTLPGSTYGVYNGTSMATPHVSGAAALLLAANPSLAVPDISRVLTETSRSNGEVGPDIHQGWGQLDAYAALASQLAVGEVVGRVTAGGVPLSGAAVTITTSGGATLDFETDVDGRFLAWLRPGAYTLQAGKYGYAPSTPRIVDVQSGETAHHELVLSRLPHGTVTGHVNDAESAGPLSGAQVTVAGIPISATTDAAGVYTLALPTGHDYTLRAQRNGFRLDTVTATVETDAPIRQDFQLDPTQTILLVDSGRWYYDSHAPYYRQALVDAGYAHDEWHVYAPGDTPSLEKLQEYDAIIWTAPQDGPAWSGGGDALASYLELGGNVFVSGQEVARLDGVGATAHRWFTRYLQGRYLGNPTAPYTLTGVSGTPYAGAHFTLNGDDSAANQIVPARVAPQAGSYTRPWLNYAGFSGEAGGALQGGWCEGHRIIFLGFGLEGAGTAAVRGDLIQGALDHFQAPPVARALDLEPKQINEVVLPGQTLTVTFNLHNLSEVQTSTIQLDYFSGWPASLSHDSLQLGPCQQKPVTLTLQVPAELRTGVRQEIELTARADYGAVSGASIVASAPAPALLVADYRWYDETAAYRAALHEQGIEFDVWDTNERGSPTLERLSIYETVLWYTGYDWFQPLTEDEIDTLEMYLQEGGRLFLSSQDYLYYHRHNPFTRDYLGVQGYQESITATAILGGDNALAGDGIEPLSLSYGLYRNFGDSVTPAPRSAAYIWNNRAFASGVATSGASWRTVFWGAPFELLPEYSRPQVLRNVLGWLGDLGDSTVEVTPRVAPAAEARQYTATIRNWQHGVGRSVVMTTTLPSSLAIEPGSIVGGARFDTDHTQVLREGNLDPGESHIVTFRAQPTGLPTPKNRIDVTTTLSYPEQNHPWQHTAPTWVAGPDLSYSSLIGEPADVKPDQVVTYTAFIRNGGSEQTGEISATVSLPRGLQILTDSLSTSSGMLTVSNKFVTWEGAVAANNVVTVTVAAGTGWVSQAHILPTGLIIRDGVSTPIVRHTTVRLSPYRHLFPIIQR